MSITTTGPALIGVRGSNIEYEDSHNLIDLLAVGLPDDHHVREFVINAIDAGASRCHFGPEWQAAKSKGVFRLQVVDNGCGMTFEEMKAFFLSFGKGKSKHGVNEHYHIGARMSSGRWNGYGLFIISHVDGKTNCMWISRDENGYYPHVFTYENDEGISTTDSVFPPDILSDDEIEQIGFDPRDILPDWVYAAGHGTAFIFMGETGTEHTFVGKGEMPGEPRIYTRSGLNARLYESPIEITVTELHGKDPSAWPTSEADLRDSGKGQANRRVIGARGLAAFDQRTSARGTGTSHVEASGTKVLSDGTKIHWILRDSIWSSGGLTFGNDKGYIALLNNNEVFNQINHYRDYYTAGVTESTVYQRLFLFGEPVQMTAGVAGVTQNVERTSLRYHESDGSTKAGALEDKVVEWLTEFGQDLPAAIDAALRAERAKHLLAGGDEKARAERLKRFRERFGAKWSRPRWRRKDGGSELGTPDHVGARPRRGDGTRPRVACALCGKLQHSVGDTCPNYKTSTVKCPTGTSGPVEYGTPGGTEAGMSINEKVGLPDVEWRPEPLAAGEWAIAEWVPATAKANGTVRIYAEHDLVLNQIRDWQTRYDKWHGGDPAKLESLATVVKEVYEDMLLSRIGHSDALKGRYPGLTDDVLTGTDAGQFRSTTALTMSMLGVFADDAAIGPRIGTMIGASSGKKVKRT